MFKNHFRLALVLVGASLISATAAAQRIPATEFSANAAAASRKLSPEARQAMQERIDAVNARFRATHGGEDPEQFGLQCCQITQIPAAAFTPADTSDTWTIDALGYMGTPATSGQVLAPVLLPSGVEITFLDLYFYDDNPTFGVNAQLRAYQGGAPSGPATSSTLVSVSSSGSPGFSYVFSTAISYTVNNNVAYDPEAAQLMVSVITTASASTAGFKAVDLWWMRQISPPPSTPTFSDVPTNHQFFQFVEALAASGITVGYPDGRFGVDDPITRGQMAVLLAKSLGLYWRY
jgi:S-layer homology domain